MNKISRKTIRDRVRDIVRAAKGKPIDHINIGIDIKNCHECDRGDCNHCYAKMIYDKTINCSECANFGEKMEEGMIMTLLEVKEKLDALCAEYHVDDVGKTAFLMIISPAHDKDMALRMIEDELKRRGPKEN